MSEDSDVAGGRRRRASKPGSAPGSAPGWPRPSNSVVSTTRTRVLQNAVSLVQLLHAFFAATTIRMMLRRHSLVAAIDINLRGILVDTQNGVVVFLRIELAHRELPDSRGAIFIWQITFSVPVTTLFFSSKAASECFVYSQSKAKELTLFGI